MSSPPSDRRQFIGLSLAGLGQLTLGGPAAHTLDAGGQSSGEAPPPPEVTRRLAEYVVPARYDDLPEAVRKEAQRTLLNWMGCAIGGSRHETLDAALAALGPFSGPPQATVLGRRERIDILNASLMNGISSHVFDFDDTHLKTVIHPAGPVASAILALSEYRPVSGTGIRQRAGRSASRPNAGSATPSIPPTTIAAGISPEPPACSAPRRRAASCWG